MTHVLIVDDHVAVRAGLRSVLRLDPTLDVAADVDCADRALDAAARVPVDVALVDYQLPGTDGLSLCRALKALKASLRVVLYTAFAGERVTLAAVVAGADAVLGKGASADEVVRAVCAVARGEWLPPPLSPDAVRCGAHDVAPEDLAIFGMRVNGTPEPEVADALHIERHELARRIDAIVAAIRPPSPRPR